MPPKTRSKLRKTPTAMQLAKSRKPTGRINKDDIDVIHSWFPIIRIIRDDFWDAKWVCVVIKTSSYICLFHLNK